MTRRLPDTLVIEIRDVMRWLPFLTRTASGLFRIAERFWSKSVLWRRKLIQVKGPGLINPEVGKKAEIEGIKIAAKCSLKLL